MVYSKELIKEAIELRSSGVSAKDISVETGFSSDEIKECLAKWFERFTSSIDFILG